MSPSVQAIRRFLEAHDRFAAHNGITVEDADYDYGKVSLAFEDHVKNSLDMLHGGALFTLADMAFGLASNFGQEDGTMISTNATISYMKSAKTCTMMTASSRSTPSTSSVCTRTIRSTKRIRRSTVPVWSTTAVPAAACMTATRAMRNP